jgi:hypothetical protein
MARGASNPREGGEIDLKKMKPRSNEENEEKKRAAKLK